MRLNILGTAGYHPTESGHTVSAIIPELGFVLDAGTGFFRAKKLIQTYDLNIFISHLHVDHSIGITYLASVLFDNPKLKKITIWGPENILDIRKLFDGSFFPVPLPEITEVKVAPPEFEVRGLKIRTLPLSHRGPAIGYRISLPRSELAYITDTSVDQKYYPLAQGVDLLIHECNFSKAYGARAEETGHTDTASFLKLINDTDPTRVLATHFDAVKEDIKNDIIIELADDPRITIAEENMVLEV